MAKPLGPKSLLIREAIKNNPKKGNTEIAELLNDAEERMDDKIKVTAQDVAAQRPAIKKAGKPAPAATAAPAAPATKPAGNGRRKGGKPQKAPARTQAAQAAGNPVDAARDVKALVEK